MARVSNWIMVWLLVLLSIAAANSETEKETVPGGEKGTTTDGEKEISQDDKVQCVKKFVEWCNKMQYPGEGASGVALMSIAYLDGTNYYRVFCSSDSEGTNCSRNGLPWFSCTPDHVLSYKGEVLTDTTTEVDNEICRTQEKAFNELFVYNMSYDNSTFTAIEKELKSFFKEIFAMRQQVHDLTKSLGDGSFMGDDFWKRFGSFPFEDDDDEDEEETVDTGEKKDTNLIEKE